MEELKPHCIRAEIAGSIRRKKPDVGDIEIVVIPKPYYIGLFEDGIASVVNKWEKVKGEMSNERKYTRRVLPGGIELDLFLAEEGNWGHVLAIRTGSAKFSHKILANTWFREGYQSIDGYLYKDGKKYEMKEEKDLFELLNLRYVEPEDRNL